jgi:hypothetical protein
MKQYLSVSITLAAFLLLFAGCSSNKSSGTADSDTNASAATQPSVPIPPDSIFAKIQTGMSEGEVVATIGQPTSEGAYTTGKAFIPFHFSGSDDVRKAMHYKGVGIIVLSNDSAYTSRYSVTEIDYDPSEPGFDR